MYTKIHVLEWAPTGKYELVAQDRKGFIRSAFSCQKQIINYLVVHNKIL